MYFCILIRSILSAWKRVPQPLYKSSVRSFLLQNSHRMTFDAVIRPTFSMCTVVLFNSSDELLGAWTQQIDSTDPLVGKAEAVFLAVSIASTLKINFLLL